MAEGGNEGEEIKNRGEFKGHFIKQREIISIHTNTLTRLLLLLVKTNIDNYINIQQ